MLTMFSFPLFFITRADYSIGQAYRIKVTHQIEVRHSTYKRIDSKEYFA